MNRKRPNTAVPDRLLHDCVLLCCGEDVHELIRSAGAMEVLDYHEFRCYKFWRTSEFTLVWTGIGTGCLEPLLCEILGCRPVKKIILIGTAGALNSRVGLGSAFWISEAHLGATAIRPNSESGLRPRWIESRPSLPPASIVSTDYYYGFSPAGSPQVRALHEHDVRLGAAVQHYSKRTDLVDMEAGQFYHFCSILADSDLQYVALKGAANSIADFTQQTLFSEQVLQKVFREAVKLATSRGPGTT